MRDAVYGGSFDPPTLGHDDIIRFGARQFNKLYVAIGVNPNKPPAFFSLEERERMLSEMTWGLTNVDIVHFETSVYLVDFAASLGARAILRGLRNASDFEAELAMAHENKQICPEIDTVFAPASPLRLGTSSSFVKGLVGPEGWQQHVGRHVHPCVLAALERKQTEE